MPRTDDLTALEYRLLRADRELVALHARHRRVVVVLEEIIDNLRKDNLALRRVMSESTENQTILAGE